MRRSLEVDVLACPRCGGRLRLIALMEASAVARRILLHLGLPADLPRPALARAPLISDGDDWARRAPATGVVRIRPYRDAFPPEVCPECAARWGVAMASTSRRVSGGW